MIGNYQTFASIFLGMFFQKTKFFQRDVLDTVSVCNVALFFCKNSSDSKIFNRFQFAFKAL